MLPRYSVGKQLRDASCFNSREGAFIDFRNKASHRCLVVSAGAQASASCSTQSFLRLSSTSCAHWCHPMSRSLVRIWCGGAINLNMSNTIVTQIKVPCAIILPVWEAVLQETNTREDMQLHHNEHMWQKSGAYKCDGPRSQQSHSNQERTPEPRFASKIAPGDKKRQTHVKVAPCLKRIQ